MAKVGAVLNLARYTFKILGKFFDQDITTEEHYALHILSQNMKVGYILASNQWREKGQMVEKVQAPIGGGSDSSLNNADPGK